MYFNSKLRTAVRLGLGPATALAMMLDERG